MRILSLTEFATARADQSRRTLDRQIAAGEGPTLTRISPHRWGVLESDGDAWLLSRRQPAPGMQPPKPPRATKAE
jgi:hypothetical protein